MRCWRNSTLVEHETSMLSAPGWATESDSWSHPLRQGVEGFLSMSSWCCAWLTWWPGGAFKVHCVLSSSGPYLQNDFWSHYHALAQHWLCLGPSSGMTLTWCGCWLRSAVLARRAVQEYIITSIKEVLRIHFNRAVELKVGPCGGEPDAGAQVKAALQWPWDVLFPLFPPFPTSASVSL